MCRILLGLAMVGWCLMMSGPAFAHHGSSGGASASLSQSISDKIEPPRSNLYFTFEANFLDEGVGEYFLYQLDGAYAFNPRFSLGARIPIYMVYQDFVPDNTRIGDVALDFKGMPWYSIEGKMILLTGLDLSFPTGNDTESLGAGAVVFTPYLTINKDFGPVLLFASLLGSFEAADVVNPTLAYELGLLVPILKGSHSLDFFVSFQGSTFITGDTFTDGSTKGFITPGFAVGLTENWDAALSGRISVLDTLSFRDDVAFNDFATGLFTDIKAGFIFNIGYTF